MENDLPKLDYSVLNKELDRTKSKIMIGRDAFKASLMLGMRFIWSRRIRTACVVSTQLQWNPDWFLSLTPTTRVTVLLHELDHIGRLHAIRLGNRDPQVWNWACDYRINADLFKQGHDFAGTDGLLDLNLAKELPEEDIYDLLMQNPNKQPQGVDYDMSGDISDDPDNQGNDDGDDGVDGVDDSGQPAKLEGRPAPGTQGAHSEKMAQVKATLLADQYARSRGFSGMSAGVRQVISDFLDPVLPWGQILVNELTELDESDYSWQRPNRRYDPTYLPKLLQEENRLTKLNYYIDTSGSISDSDIVRFNSELRFIKESLNPETLLVVMFDSGIRSIFTIKDTDPFNDIEIYGRGGTSLHEVKEHIELTRPTAAIIFSDLDCFPMDELSFPVPIYWVVINNPDVKPPFGTAYHIKT